MNNSIKISNGICLVQNQLGIRQLLQARNWMGIINVNDLIYDNIPYSPRDMIEFNKIPIFKNVRRIFIRDCNPLFTKYAVSTYFHKHLEEVWFDRYFPDQTMIYNLAIHGDKPNIYMTDDINKNEIKNEFMQLFENQITEISITDFNTVINDLKNLVERDY